MPKAIVKRKGKIKKITPPLRYKAGGGKDVYIGGELVMTDTMTANRTLTRKEINFEKKKVKEFGKKHGYTVVTKGDLITFRQKQRRT